MRRDIGSGAYELDELEADEARDHGRGRRDRRDDLALPQEGRCKATWKTDGARPVHLITTMISGFGPVGCQYRTLSLWGVRVVQR